MAAIILRVLGALILVRAASGSLRRYGQVSFSSADGAAGAGHEGVSPSAAAHGADVHAAAAAQQDGAAASVRAQISVGVGAGAASGVRTLASGVRTAMLEATVTSLDTLGSTLVVAACIMVSVLVLIGIASLASREKELMTPRFQEEAASPWPLPRASGAQRGSHYSRRQRPADAVCLARMVPRESRLPQPSPACTVAQALQPAEPPPALSVDNQRMARPLPPPAAAQQGIPTPPDDSESGSGEGRRQSSQSSSQTSSSYQPLCPGLVVRQPGGISLAMVGVVAPYRQSEVIEFKRTDANRDVLARAILSEDSEGGGIILESALRLPIAFLDTKDVVARRADERPLSCHVAVAVSRMSGAGACAEPPFGAVTMEPAGEGCVMRRAQGGRDDTILAVRLHGDGRVANVVDAEGRLLAATESRRPEPGARPLRLLHIASGVDSGLVMVAILAAAKLGPTGSLCAE